MESVPARNFLATGGTRRSCCFPSQTVYMPRLHATRGGTPLPDPAGSAWETRLPIAVHALADCCLILHCRADSTRLLINSLARGLRVEVLQARENGRHGQHEQRRDQNLFDWLSPSLARTQTLIRHDLLSPFPPLQQTASLPAVGPLPLLFSRIEASPRPSTPPSGRNSVVPLTSAPDFPLTHSSPHTRRPLQRLP